MSTHTNAHARATGTGIGQPVVRKEDQRLLTGQGRYTDDVNLPGQAYAVMVRSPHAHARIVSIDTAAALEVPGVLLVLTGADAVKEGIGSMSHGADIVGKMDVPLANRDGTPRRTTPHLLLPPDKARYVGVAVAAVIAESVGAAQEAADLLEIEYEPLEAVTVTAAAVSDSAPLVWEDRNSNLCVDGDFGDRAATDAAFKTAAHVAKATIWINRVTSVPMEPRSAVSDYDTKTGKLTMYCGADGSVRRKREFAQIFGMEEHKVRVIARDVGGNFGSRNWNYAEYGITAWASRKLGRPVKWTAMRSEGLISDYMGRDLYAEAELALDKDGKFLALRSDHVSNIGGYVVNYTPLNKSCELLSSVYHIPVGYVRGRGVLSNTSPTAPYRSAGRPEAMLIMERLIEVAAREFGFDKVELRRKNLIPESAMPYKNPLGLTYDSGDYEEAMDRVLKMSDWGGFPARKTEAKARGKLRGIGLSNYIEVTTGAPRERTDITVLPEGSVEVVIGTTAAGQGHETSFAQCIVDFLGVPFESIKLITGDTDIVKEGGGSHSARSMRMAGIVMGQASDIIIAKAIKIAAHVFEASVEDVEFTGGRFRVKGTDKAMQIFEVAKAARDNKTLPEDLKGPLAGTSDDMLRVPGFPYGAQTCEVEIDPETGILTLINIAAVDDVGTAINPLILHGQTHGGIVQGFGQALMEQCYYDPESGQMLTGSFMDYAMPHADSFPSFKTDIMEVPSPTNKLGVRGGGEGGTTPALAVVVNAIVDALADYGVTDIEMPATPERIWRAIHERGYRPSPLSGIKGAGIKSA